jgi:hypothetical protein
MSGLTDQAGLARTVELKGHVIDSLTLSKVIDRVQQLGGDYRLNDIHVGSLKKDISAINLTLIAPDAETMNALMEAVAPYGAVAESTDAETISCEQAGVLPEDAYRVKLPQTVRWNGQALCIDKGGDWALVIKEGQAQMVSASTVLPGDCLVRGTHGLDW